MTPESPGPDDSDLYLAGGDGAGEELVVAYGEATSRARRFASAIDLLGSRPRRAIGCFALLGIS